MSCFSAAWWHHPSLSNQGFVPTLRQQQHLLSAHEYPKSPQRAASTRLYKPQAFPFSWFSCVYKFSFIPQWLEHFRPLPLPLSRRSLSLSSATLPGLLPHQRSGSLQMVTLSDRSLSTDWRWSTSRHWSSDPRLRRSELASPSLEYRKVYRQKIKTYKTGSPGKGYQVLFSFHFLYSKFFTFFFFALWNITL